VDEAYARMTQKCAGMGSISKFPVPSSKLRVGTLDSLMSLSDELVKHDNFAEAIVGKIRRQLVELGGKATEELPMLEGGIPVDSYLQKFVWDERQYPVTAPLKNITTIINESLSRFEDELKTKVTDYMQVKGGLAAIQRKEGGNLMVKSLSEIVKASHFIESEHLTTILIVVPKTGWKQWLKDYEFLSPNVVPRSARMIHHEPPKNPEFGLWTVTLFRKNAEEFKQAARDKRYTIRDFIFDPDALTSEKEEKMKLSAQQETAHASLLRWCKNSFSESFKAWVHLKTVRCFVESVLRYGLPVNFLAVMAKPNKKSEEKMKKTLGAMYGDGSDHGAADEDLPGMAGQGEFYPYVYLSFNIV